MEIVFIIGIIFFIGLFIYQQSQTASIKSKSIKKSEIIKEYQEKLELCDSKEEKIAYIKTINDELSRNIFFEKNEIKDVIEDMIKKAI